MKMEVKTAGPYEEAFDVVDIDQGIVSEIICVYGIVDEGGDRVNDGAFTKTIAENAGNFRVVDSHNHRTVQAILGVNLGMEEIAREQLPPATQAQFSEATGGVRALTRYLLQTPEGYGAFIRRKEGALPSSSFGYNALDTTMNTEKTNGKKRRIRDIHTLRLHEYGPCVLPMNPATSVVAIKGEPVAIEGKPWGIFMRDGEYCVYRTDADGAAEGESRGCHGTLEDAEKQVAALYANVEDSDGAAMSGTQMATTGAASEEWLTIVWEKAAEQAGPDAGPLDVLGIALDWIVAMCEKYEAETGLTPGLADQAKAWIQTVRGEGKTEQQEEEEEAGPDDTTSPADDSGPGPEAEEPPTSPELDVALLAAKIKIARARLGVDLMLQTEI